VTAVGYAPAASTAMVTAWGGTRAAFRAIAELRPEDFAMSYHQVVAADVAAVGTTLTVELDIQAVQGDTLAG